jgi:ATP-dependent exoDNAse (exonuclease V) beta subunit
MKQDLVQLIESDLEMVATIFPLECKQELVKLLRYAAKNINGPATKISSISVFPDCGVDNLAYWYGVSTLLLTQSGTWRKQFTKREGFPVSGKTEKAKAKSLIEKLEKIDLLEKRLQKINDLPSVDSLEIGWELIELAKKLLKTTAAQLEIIFSEHNLVDFTGVSQHAVNALGEDNCPTNLALTLDYQIKHLLVDEVQDVSESQYRLLHCLTREWSVGDGRTLFLVGDPQQAIYRFRGAEVRFFLKIFKDGSLGNIPLEPLKISKNFRASSDLVNWVNGKFAKIFPEENLIEGAVPFIDSIPTRLESRTCISHYSVGGNKEEAKKLLR